MIDGHQPIDAVVILGPGRSGTTSIYYSAKSSLFYEVNPEKERFFLDANAPPNKSTKTYFDCHPKNLARIDRIEKLRKHYNLNYFYLFIARDPFERLESLYKYHSERGSNKDTFDEYIKKNIEEAQEFIVNPSKKLNYVYSGVFEYSDIFFNQIPDSTWIINYKDLFRNLNSLLQAHNLQPLKEQKRNNSITPKFPKLHRAVHTVIKYAPLNKFSFLDTIKRKYLEYMDKGSVYVDNRYMDDISQLIPTYMTLIRELEVKNARQKK